MMRLYDYALSGNCFKVRQLLAWLRLPYETVPVDFHPGRAHKSQDFLLHVNPLGQLPVLDDNGFVVRDAQAILVYLATGHDPAGCWFPNDAQARGEVVMWLATAESLTQTASAARLHDVFGHDCNVQACRRDAHQQLRLLDDHLAEREAFGLRWLVGEQATLADLACFPYAALAPEGGIALDAYPSLRRWIWDFRHLPGFVGMPGILPPPV